VDLISEVKNFETLAARLASLARFVVLDLGAGLPTFVQKLLSMCNERIVVVGRNAQYHSAHQILIDEILAGLKSTAIHYVVLNNRQRTEAQMSWTQVQEKLGHPVTDHYPLAGIVHAGHHVCIPRLSLHNRPI
jgi:MinD-like ATPase involved in chromosome partitioning or flagellar assembly